MLYDYKLFLFDETSMLEIVNLGAKLNKGKVGCTKIDHFCWISAEFNDIDKISNKESSIYNT